MPAAGGPLPHPGGRTPGRFAAPGGNRNPDRHVEAGMNLPAPLSLAGALGMSAVLAAGCGSGNRTADPPAPYAAPAIGAPYQGGGLPRASTLAAAGGVGTTASLTTASLTATSATPTVTTTGTGTVSGQPDTLTIGIGVSTSAAHAADALAQNNSIAAAVQAALRSDGVAAADISTTSLSLQQNWNGSGADGYAAYDEVTATLHDLGRAGRIIDDALAPAGDSGRLQEVALSFSDSDPLMAAARTRAAQSARTQATQMAQALGGHLGALLSVTDSQSAPPVYPSSFGPASAGAASASAQVPVQPGTQQVTTQVTTVFAFVPGS